MPLVSVACEAIGTDWPRPMALAVKGGSTASATTGAVASGTGTALAVVKRAMIPEASDSPAVLKTDGLTVIV